MSRQYIGKNNLKSMDPALASEWHPNKNGDLTPEFISCYDKRKVWWLLNYEDPNTGKVFSFEWQASVEHRFYDHAGCPFLCGKAVMKGFNDLHTLRPDLSAEWHPVLNGNLKPDQVTEHSGKKVWWILPYDDPNTGKHFDFVWQSSVDKRANGEKCPVLFGKMIWPGYNDLATVKPEIAKQWHPTLNGATNPCSVFAYSNKSAWWIYPYTDPETGKHFDFIWKSRISARVNSPGCPFLHGKVWPGFNDLKTRSPELAKQWNYEKNDSLGQIRHKKLIPENVAPTSREKVWWIYHYYDPITGKHFVFEWLARIGDRYRGDGCPFLYNRRVWPGFNDLATKRPDIAEKWCYEKNGSTTPQMVTVTSNKKYWWECPYCGYQDRITVAHMSTGQACKNCGRS